MSRLSLKDRRFYSASGSYSVVRAAAALALTSVRPVFILETGPRVGLVDGAGSEGYWVPGSGMLRSLGGGAEKVMGAKEPPLEPPRFTWRSSYFYFYFSCSFSLIT